MGVYIPNMEHPKDGLYQIDHGKIHKYKGKGGTVRIYDLIEIPSELDVMTLKSEAEALGYVAIKKSEFETYLDLVKCGECKYQFSCGQQIKRNGLTLKLTCCEYGERRADEHNTERD